MKIKKLFVFMIMLLAGLSLASCNKGPKATVAYDKLDACKEFCEMHLGVTENDTIEYRTIKFVEITNDPLVTSIIGNVYYCIGYTITHSNGMTEMGTIYPYYDYNENTFYYWEKYSQGYYEEFKGHVEYGTTDGVIGTIE